VRRLLFLYKTEAKPVAPSFTRNLICSGLGSGIALVQQPNPFQHTDEHRCEVVPDDNGSNRHLDADKG